jgi:hypothetical protein
MRSSFTHKSFGEYLTGRRLVREVARICKGRCDNADYYSEQQALAEWAKVTGAQAMSMDLLRFLRDEVALRPEPDVRTWQETLTSLCNSELRTGFPVIALPADGFREMERRARNAEIAFVGMLSSVGTSINGVAPIKWDHEYSAQELISRIYNFFPDAGFATSMFGCWRTSKKDLRDLLSYINYDAQSIICRDLSNLDLSRCSFRASQLFMVNFCESDLEGVDFRMARIEHAECVEANLSGADLSGANFSRANLSGANLSGADLIGANLSGANLSRATNLTREQIEEAQDITGAKLPDYLKQAGRRSPRRRPGVRKATP